MPDSTPVSRQVRLENLWAVLRSLATRLWSSGLGEERLHEVWRSDVVVRCDACDSRLSGDDLAAVLDLPEGSEPPPGRLQRLSQGYCPKPGCSSRFYRITLPAADDIDWNRFLTDAEATANEEPAPTTADPQVQSSGRGILANGKVRIALALMALVAAFLLREWYLNGRIPFVTRTFQVAPAPSGFPAQPDPSSSPGSPQTNVFKVAH